VVSNPVQPIRTVHFEHPTVYDHYISAWIILFGTFNVSVSRLVALNDPPDRRHATGERPGRDRRERSYSAAAAAAGQAAAGQAQGATEELDLEAECCTLEHVESRIENAWFQLFKRRFDSFHVCFQLAFNCFQITPLH
jgi:hypothetical protein